MAGDSAHRPPRLHGVALWAPIAGLLALGLITTLVDLSSLSTRETALANANLQRFVVNPVSGDVSLGTSDSAATDTQDSFDVGSAAEATQAKTDEASASPAPATEPAPAVETPAPVETPPSTMPVLRTSPTQTALTMPSHTKDSLVSAPAPEVTETIGTLQLPKRGDKDVLPSKLYAQPFTRTPDQVLISFVVVDFGLDPQSIGLLSSLPKEITAAYTPYTHKDAAYSEELRALGHEVWTMLPTMNERYPSDDPGPLGLISQMPEEESARRLLEVLGVIPGSVGLILPPDETITAQKNALSNVVREVSRRGLLMLSTHPSHSLEQVTTDKTLHPLLHRADLVLDPEPNEAQIRSKLAGLMDAAKEKGEYLVVLSARPQSLEILADWLKGTKFAEPFALAPLSALYQPKEAPEAAEPAKDDGHGGGHGGGEKKKEKKQPKAKPPKPLPLDKYKQPAAGAKEGGHGGGGH